VTNLNESQRWFLLGDPARLDAAPQCDAGTRGRT
jgi:hypothetical protein